jgi:predicted enzyme related to lactoylglutathione lyase
MSTFNSTAQPAVWFDIPVADSTAPRLLRAVLKIDVTKQEFDGFAFCFLAHDEGNGGCLVPAPARSARRAESSSISTSDGRNSRRDRQVEERGGKVKEPVHSIGPHGFRAVVLDSEGNRIALHSSSRRVKRSTLREFQLTLQPLMASSMNPAAQTARLRIEPLRASHAPLLFDALAGCADLHLRFRRESMRPSIRSPALRIPRARRSAGTGEVWLNWAVQRIDTGAYIGTLQATVTPIRTHGSAMCSRLRPGRKDSRPSRAAGCSPRSRSGSS